MVHSWQSFMAIENGFENLDISSAEEVFDEDNQTDIEEARQLHNYEVSTGQITNNNNNRRGIHTAVSI
jgi:hypothetical protein